MKKILGIIAVILLSPALVLAATPTILDTLPVTGTYFSNVTSTSFTYTVPAGGQNKLEIVYIVANRGDAVISATQNGVSMTCSGKFHVEVALQLGNRFNCYLA